MTSQDMIKQPNSKIGVRVRLWKDEAGSALSPVMRMNNSRASLSKPARVRKIAVRFNAAPGRYHIEVSDSGGYSTIWVEAAPGSSSVTVDSTRGFVVGGTIIIRNSIGTDKFRITDISGFVISFDGSTSRIYTANNATAESDQWWKVLTGDTSETGTWFTYGEPSDDHPMVAVYGQYWRVAPGGVWRNNLSDFELYEDTYYDLSEYVTGQISIRRSVDLTTGKSPLPDCSVRFQNVDDRFNRRNDNSPYVDGSIHHLRYPRAMTVEWIAKAADWKIAQTPTFFDDDWRLLATFTARQWTVSRSDHAFALVQGETLHRLRYPIDIPLLEVASIREIMADWVLTEEHREELVEQADDAVKHRVAVLQGTFPERASTSFNETVGRGTFGYCKRLYHDASEEDPILYAGFYGIATTGNFLYTCHSLEKPEGNYERGMYIVKRFMNGIPVGPEDIYIFYESDTTDIEEGDIVVIGDYLWVHTAQQNVTNNIFKIDMADWTVDASYATKGSVGHYPVHATTDGTYLYVMYSGGAEGRVLYKCNASDYSTIWSHTFSAGDNETIDAGVSGLVLIGVATLLIFTRKTGTTADYQAIRFTLSDSPAYATYDTTIDFLTLLEPSASDNNTYGWASVVATGSGLFALTGPATGSEYSSGVIGMETRLWDSRSGSLILVGDIRFYLQNGNIVNAVDEYNDPLAAKDAVNYSLEEIYVNEELQDNTGTYDGTIKTTDDYVLNLRTGELLFVTPPQYGTRIKAYYDYETTLQYFKADNVQRWESVRALAETANAVVFATAHERVAYAAMRKQEGYVFLAGAGGTARQLSGRNIIHPSNSAYSFNTVQVSNFEHNRFYLEDTDYEIQYDASDGVYVLQEIGQSLAGHIVVSYMTGRTDDTIVTLDDNAVLNPATIMAMQEEWDFGTVVNQVIVEGERSFPLDTPLTILETYAVSPFLLNVDSSISKVQRATGTEQYMWDSENNIFTEGQSDNVKDGGFIVEFPDPILIGTTQWYLREPDTSQVEYDTENQPGGPAFVKVTWGTPFLEPGSAVETTNYDVLLDNYDYWRVCAPGDQDAPGWTPGEIYKTGAHVYIKKFRDDGGGGGSDDVTIYAYKVKDTPFYIDKAGLMQEAELTEAENPIGSASPDKRIYVRVEPLDSRDAHLFREAGTYDGVVIPADYAMAVGAVKIGYDGLTVDLLNYADVESYLKLVVTGYPISGLENIKTKCEDRITLDGTASSIDELGERPHSIANPHIQSPGVARTVGFNKLDWLKYEHSDIPVQAKFSDELDLLNPCLITADYGNFDSESELWIVAGIHYRIINGARGMSSVTYRVLDMQPSPSRPGPASS